MDNYILSKIFLDVYNNMERFDNNKKIIRVKDYEELNEALMDYLVDILGYNIKHDYHEHFGEIRKYFENIIYNTKDNYYNNIIDCIKSYTNEYKNKINSHPYFRIFIDAVGKLYSNYWDGKVLTESSPFKSMIEASDIAISNIHDSFIISRFPRKDEEPLPSIYINNIDHFEEALKEYVETVKNSDCFYNIFNNPYMENMTEESKIKMLIECTIFNATNADLLNIEQFFRRYNDFIKDDTLEQLRKVTYVGNAFDDELYVRLKQAELEYETPYYLAYMLKNKVVELPNVRLGIENKDGIKVAHILAIQTTQLSINRSNLELVQKEIKENLPSDPYFRFYNPSHLISLLITFGILNGMGIQEIEVKDYLPFRYLKTTLDKSMGEDEAIKYQTRLTNKNIITYMRLISVTDGIDINSYPDMDVGLSLRLQDEIICKNEYLQNLYDMAYNFGKQYKIENAEMKIQQK